MVRPCLIGCTQVLLAAVTFFTVSGCGQGLFTSNAFRSTDGDAGPDSAIDGPGGGRDVLVSPDRQAAPDQPVSSDTQTTQDALVPGASTTQEVDYNGKLVTLGDAILDVPKGAFPTGAPNVVALTLESNDGTLPGYAGAIGPIYSITKTTAQWNSVTLRIRFTLNPSIPLDRVALAYQDTLAHLWILMNASYDAAAGMVSGTVVDFSGTRLFAPVESCIESQDAGTCPGPFKCQGGACQ
jgi:hypothetical protein